MAPDSTPTPTHPTQPHYRNILFIEDEHFISDLYTRALTKAGYNVKLATDGNVALSEAQTNQYDIILLDIMVPHITGIELLKRLRGPQAQPPIKAKIIITTNLEQNEQAKHEIMSQADGYLIKAEITPKQLVAFLQALEPARIDPPKK